MQSPSVVSNGAKVREDETEVLAGSREVTLCLAIDLGAAFRFRLRNALLREWFRAIPTAPPAAFMNVRISGCGRVCCLEDRRFRMQASLRETCENGSKDS